VSIDPAVHCFRLLHQSIDASIYQVHSVLVEVSLSR
jgi:hypothetical protein